MTSLIGQLQTSALPHVQAGLLIVLIKLTAAAMLLAEKSGMIEDMSNQLAHLRAEKTELTKALGNIEVRDAHTPAGDLMGEVGGGIWKWKSSTIVESSPPPPPLPSSYHHH